METLLEKPSLHHSRTDKTVIALGVASALLILWIALTYPWPGYADMVTSLPHPIAWLRWVLGDISEVAFYKHELASIGLLGGAYLAWWASRTGKPWQGFAISYGTGLWP